jgi:hypothetical protein
VLQQDDSGASWKELLLKLQEDQCVLYRPKYATAADLRQKGILGAFPVLPEHQLAGLGFTYKESYTMQKKQHTEATIAGSGLGDLGGGVQGANPTDTEWRRMD